MSAGRVRAALDKDERPSCSLLMERNGDGVIDLGPQAVARIEEGSE